MQQHVQNTKWCGKKMKFCSLRKILKTPVEQIRSLMESIDSECPHGHYFKKNVIDTETFEDVIEHNELDMCDDDKMLTEDDSEMSVEDYDHDDVEMSYQIDLDTAVEASHHSDDENDDHDNAADSLVSRHSLGEESCHDSDFIDHDKDGFVDDSDHDDSGSEIKVRDRTSESADHDMPEHDMKVTSTDITGDLVKLTVHYPPLRSLLNK